MTVQILTGDCREMLATLPERSVQCCVTSPPYHGLRAYGGDPGMIGLEPTIDEHISALVDVFRGVWRVLRDDGTVWLNYGDAYAGSGKGAWDKTDVQKEVYVPKPGGPETQVQKVPNGLKPKDLIGLPWRIAFALQADGWYLRSAIVWHKPNPMPESVTDRPTSAYENIFLLTKSARYFYDAAAIAEPATNERLPGQAIKTTEHYGAGNGGNTGLTAFLQRYHNGNAPTTRNARNVWTIATAGFSEAHFAVFPPEIPRRCILAGTSDKGECPACGAPWVRVTERTPNPLGINGGEHREPERNGALGKRERRDYASERAMGNVKLIGWQPSCTCDAGDPVPQTVLDPFAGAGTTLLVADRLGRNAVGVEVNPEYVAMAQRRITNDAPLFVELETA